jgi:hypothetical protein
MPLMQMKLLHSQKHFSTPECNFRNSGELCFFVNNMNKNSNEFPIIGMQFVNIRAFCLNTMIGKKKHLRRAVFLTSFIITCKGSTKHHLTEMTYHSQIELLLQEIKLQESNYKYAVELQKGINIQIYLKEHIRKLKEDLLRLQNEKAYSIFSIEQCLFAEN